MQTIHFVAKLDVTKHETSWTQWSTPFQVQNVFNSKIHSHHVFTVHYKFKSEVKAIIKLLKTGSWKNGCHFLKEISCAIKVLIDLIEQSLISPHNSPIKWSLKLFSWNLASIKNWPPKKTESLIELDMSQKTFDNYHLEEENREIEQFYILKKLWKADSNLTRSERQYYPDQNHTFAILNFTFE